MRAVLSNQTPNLLAHFIYGCKKSGREAPHEAT